jgi:hypothetical protein
MTEHSCTIDPCESGAHRTYTVLYAVDVPHYGLKEIKASDDAEALAAARLCDTDGIFDEAQWDGAVCERIVYIEDSDGNTPYRDVPLDQYSLRSGGDADRRLCEGAAGLLAALKRFEAAWRSWAEDIRRYPKLAASCELYSIYEEARAAIARATGAGEDRRPTTSQFREE